MKPGTLKPVTLFALVLLLAGWGSLEAFALGSDHPKEQLAAQGPNCVHGFFINESDVFFFAGDAADFNRAAAELVRKGTKVQIVVHRGAKKARSPWDKADRDLPTDWSVTTGPMARSPSVTGPELVRIDVWLGGRIEEADLQYPSEAEIVSEGEFKPPNDDHPPGRE